MNCHFVLGYAATAAVAVGYAEVGDDLRECYCGHFGEGWMVQRGDDVMI